MQYMGSKRRFRGDIIELVDLIKYLTGADTYIEPFAGGFNVIPYIDIEHRIGNDINKYVVALFNRLRESGVEGFPEDISREEYKAVKDNPGLYENWYVGCVGLLGSYNGTWMGSYGAHKIGKRDGYVNEYKYRVNSLSREYKDKEIFKGIDVSSIDYREMDIPDGAIVYCDPPYKGVSGYKNKFNHDEFYEWVRELSKRCMVIISEYSMPDDFVAIKRLGISGRDLGFRFKGSESTGKTDYIYIHKDCYKLSKYIKQ